MESLIGAASRAHTARIDRSSSVSRREERRRSSIGGAASAGALSGPVGALSGSEGASEVGVAAEELVEERDAARQLRRAAELPSGAAVAGRRVVVGGEGGHRNLVRRLELRRLHLEGGAATLVALSVASSRRRRPRRRQPYLRASDEKNDRFLPRAGGPAAGGAAKPGMTGGRRAAPPSRRGRRGRAGCRRPAGGPEEPVESVLETSDLKRSDIEPVRPLFVSSSLSSSAAPAAPCQRRAALERRLHAEAAPRRPAGRR